MNKLAWRVDGMDCSACERRLGTVLGRVEGVREVSADHSTGRVEVRAGSELTDRSVLVEQIEAAGFEVVEEMSA